LKATRRARARTTEPAAQSRTSYWEAYYARRPDAGRRLPSQFAVFVAGELDGRHRVIDLGCGDGRDALFFAEYGHDVVGVDASASAIDGCRGRARALGLDASFVVASIDDPGLAEQVRSEAGPQLVYARFFLHAISAAEETSLLELAAAIVRAGDLLAVEYRTIRDASGVKVTDDHFRRFIMPATFEARALDHGFDVEYSVEGFGFAKYRADDAYVARTIFRRQR